KCNYPRVRQHKPAQHRRHERIGAAILQETVDPELKSAMQGELCSKHLVLGKNQEEQPNRDPQHRQCPRILEPWINVAFHSKGVLGVAPFAAPAQAPPQGLSGGRASHLMLLPLFSYSRFLFSLFPTPT